MNEKIRLELKQSGPFQGDRGPVETGSTGPVDRTGRPDYFGGRPDLTENLIYIGGTLWKFQNSQKIEFSSIFPYFGR